MMTGQQKATARAEYRSGSSESCADSESAGQRCSEAARRRGSTARHRCHHPAHIFLRVNKQNVFKGDDAAAVQIHPAVHVKSVPGLYGIALQAGEPL